MKKRSMRLILTALFLTCWLYGCASSSGLYSWGNYESQVYAYLNGESREAQLATLERDLERIEARGMQVPPGFYAHLGLLYSETGNDAMAILYFQTEKIRFPEAAAYMNFLLTQYGVE
jgi:hypothetical protein